MVYRRIDVTDGSPMEANQRLQMRIAIQTLDRLDRAAEFNVNYFYPS